MCDSDNNKNDNDTDFIKDHLFSRLLDLDQLKDIFECEDGELVETIVDMRNKYVVMEDRLKYITEKLKECNVLDTDTIDNLLQTY